MSENIYQMYARLGGAGFFVKRYSWPNPKAGARVISVGGQTSGALPGILLHHAESQDWEKPKVIAAVSYYGEPASMRELTSPETYAYILIEQPEGWQEVDTNWVANTPSL